MLSLRWLSKALNRSVDVSEDAPLPVRSAGANGTASPRVVARPNTQSIAAAGTSIVYKVTAGAAMALTLTQAPGATVPWAGTMRAEQSADGVTYVGVDVAPKMGLPGALAPVAAGGDITGPGLWIVQTDDDKPYIRIRSTAWTTGTCWTYVEAWDQPNATIQLPWTPTVALNTDLMTWLDMSGLSEISAQVSVVTTTVAAFQGTNDPTASAVNTIPFQDTGVSTSSGGTTITAALHAKMVPNGQNWARLRITTAGTAFTVLGLTARRGQITSICAQGSSTSVVAQGAAATGVTAAGNPLFTGIQARTVQPTARTDGQMAPVLGDKLGRLPVRLGHIRDLTVESPQVAISTTTETTIVAAVASLFNDLGALTIASTAVFSGTPTGARLDFRDTTAGTVRFSVALPASGGAFNDEINRLGNETKQATVNTNWTVQLVFVGGSSPAISSGDIRITPKAVQNV